MTSKNAMSHDGRILALKVGSKGVQLKSRKAKYVFIEKTEKARLQTDMVYLSIVPSQF